LLRIGKVVRAVGLKGLLGVGGTAGALGALERITLRREGRDVEKVVLEARPQAGIWAVQVDGIADRTAAEQWIGAEVLAEREDLGEVEAGAYYWADLEGLPVVTAGGRELGVVDELYETGAVDVLVVRGDGIEHLIPLAPYVTVDLDSRRIVVDPPDGLLAGDGDGPGTKEGGEQGAG